MVILLVLGMLWFALALGVVGLCAAAKRADALTAEADRPGPAPAARAAVRRGSRPGGRLRRRAACVGAPPRRAAHH